MTFRELLYEKVISLSELESLMKLHDISIISAFRGGSECSSEGYSKSDNIKRSALMKKEISSSKYTLIDVQGMWQGGKEKSFILIDESDTHNLKSFTESLGKKYFQDAIVYKEPTKPAILISTNTCPDAYPGFGKMGVKETIGHLKHGKDAEFYTKIGKEYFHFA